jgi:hypothetical protein
MRIKYCPEGIFGTCETPDGWETIPFDAHREMETQQKVSLPIELLTNDERTGLGDLIERGIKSIGLDVLAKWWEKHTGKSCGCEKRKAWLNRLANWKKTRSV